MNGMNWNIDELVAQVMADLRQTPVETPAADVSAALARDFNSIYAESNSVSKQSDRKVEDDVFEITERVVVADAVRRLSKSTSAKRWSAPSNAVVTPAAKDEMRALGVELVVARPGSDVRSSGSSAPTLSSSNVDADFAAAPRTVRAVVKPIVEKSKSAASVLIATHLPDDERFPQSVREYLSRNAEATEIRFSCLKETTRRIAEEVNNDKALKVVLATHDAAIGSIWANRLSGVRAVVAYTFEQTKRDIAATNANVVVVDPRDVGPYPFRQIVDYFIRS